MASTQPGVNQSSQDIVAILDADNFQPLFSGSNIMTATVRESSKLTNWAVEDGTQRTDHRVIDPVSIDLPVLLSDDTRALFEQLRNAFIDGRNLIVQTKVRSYSDMMIIEMPHDETPEYGEAVPVTVKLQELRVVKPEFGTLPPSRVANKKQASTVSKGNQQSTTAPADGSTQRRASVAYGIFN
jgi:hypothetical protein